MSLPPPTTHNQRERERERERERGSFTILLDEMRRIFIGDRTLRVVAANYGPLSFRSRSIPFRLCKRCKLILRVMWKTARGPGLERSLRSFAYSIGEYSRSGERVRRSQNVFANNRSSFAPLLRRIVHLWEI